MLLARRLPVLSVDLRLLHLNTQMRDMHSIGPLLHMEDLLQDAATHRSGCISQQMKIVLHLLRRFLEVYSHIRNQ